MAAPPAASALPALTNPATPGRALWNVTSPVRPDPIPRARHARATPAHAAHSVLVWALLHTACSNTLHKLHERTAPRTRLGARLAAAQPTGSPVGLELWRPAFIMLGATSTTCKLCIYNAESCHLTVDTVTEWPHHRPLRERKERTERERRAGRRTTANTGTHTRHIYQETHLNKHTHTGEMKGRGGTPARGRGGARQGAEGAAQRKRPAAKSPGAQQGATPTSSSNFPGVAKAPRNLAHTYGGVARQNRDRTPEQGRQPYNWEQQELNRHTPPQQGHQFQYPPQGGQPTYQDNMGAWNNPSS